MAAVDLEELGRAVKRAQFRQHRTLEAELASIGTTVVQWDALRAIGRMPGASAHDLALATFQTDQAFGTLAARLLAQDLITRAAGTGRRIDHGLTAKGEALLAQGNVVADRVRRQLFAPLTDADRQALAGLLGKLAGPAGGGNEPA